MKQSTSGPWTFNGGDSAPILHLYGPDGKGLFHKDRTLEEQEANAELMAAAPDLLASVVELLKWCKDPASKLAFERYDYAEDFTRIVMRAEAAIAKTEGVSA